MGGGDGVAHAPRVVRAVFRVSHQGLARGIGPRTHARLARRNPFTPALPDAMLAQAAHAVQRTMVRAKIGAATRDGAP